MNQHFAKIEDGVVVDVVVATADFMAANPERYPGEWVETFVDVYGVQMACVGGLYNAETNTFAKNVITFAPVVDPPLPFIEYDI